MHYNTSEQVTFGIVQGVAITVTLYMFVIGPSTDVVLAEYFADLRERDQLSPESIKLM